VRSVPSGRVDLLGALADGVSERTIGFELEQAIVPQLFERDLEQREVRGVSSGILRELVEQRLLEALVLGFGMLLQRALDGLLQLVLGHRAALAPIA